MSDAIEKLREAFAGELAKARAVEAAEAEIERLQKKLEDHFTWERRDTEEFKLPIQRLAIATGWKPLLVRDTHVRVDQYASISGKSPDQLIVEHLTSVVNKFSNYTACGSKFVEAADYPGSETDKKTDADIVCILRAGHRSPLCASPHYGREWSIRSLDLASFEKAKAFARMVRPSKMAEDFEVPIEEIVCAIARALVPFVDKMKTKPEPKKKKCEACHGTGSTWSSGLGINMDSSPIEKTCAACFGEGVVKQEQK